MPKVIHFMSLSIPKMTVQNLSRNKTKSTIDGIISMRDANASKKAVRQQAAPENSKRSFIAM